MSEVAARRVAQLGPTEEGRWYPFSEVNPDPRGHVPVELAFRGPVLAVIRLRSDGVYLLEVKRKVILTFVAGDAGCELFVTETAYQASSYSFDEAKAAAGPWLKEATS